MPAVISTSTATAMAVRKFAPNPAPDDKHASTVLSVSGRFVPFLFSHADDADVATERQRFESTRCRPVCAPHGFDETHHE